MKRMTEVLALLLAANSIAACRNRTKTSAVLASNTQVTVLIDNGTTRVTEQVTYLSQGKTGAVFVRAAGDKVLKVPFDDADSARDFAEEKSFFIDLARELRSVPAHAGFMDYVVPTTVVHVEVNNRRIESLEKIKAPGNTIESLTKEQRETPAYLEKIDKLYDDLRALVLASYEAYDMHDRNILWDGSKFYIVDALYKGRSDGFEALTFDSDCARWPWCREKTSRDLRNMMTESFSEAAVDADRGGSADAESVTEPGTENKTHSKGNQTSGPKGR